MFLHKKRKDFTFLNNQNGWGVLVRYTTHTSIIIITFSKTSLLYSIITTFDKWMDSNHRSIKVDSLYLLIRSPKVAPIKCN